MLSVAGEGRHVALVLETGRKAEYCQQWLREVRFLFFYSTVTFFLKFERSYTYLYII